MSFSPSVASVTGTFVVPRTTELDRLTTALGRGRSALVVGDAGTGKTHLVTQSLTALGASLTSFAALTVHATAGADLVAALAPSGVPAPQDHSSTTVAQAVRAAVARRSRGGQVVLRVEDAHLLEPASAQALAWLVSQGEVQVVATVRRSSASEAPWYGLWKNDTVERIDARAFSESQVRTFLLAELGGTVTADTVWRMWRASAGNAFHLRELVQSQLAKNALVLHDGVWVWSGRNEPDERLRDIVRHEWDALGAGPRQALETLALAGPLRMSVLHDHADAESIRVLDQRGLVTTMPDPTGSSANEFLVDVAHERFAQAVLELVPHRRRRETLGALAPHSDATDAALVRRVLHSLDCGLDVDPGAIDSAVRTALRTYEGTVAARIIDLTLERDPAPELAAVLLMYRSNAWRVLDDPMRARDDLTRASGLLLDGAKDDALLDDAMVGRLLTVAEQRANLHQFYENDVDGAQRIVDTLAPRVLSRIPPERFDHWQRFLSIATLRRQGYAGRHMEVTEASRQLLSHPVNPVEVIGLVCPTALGLSFMGRSEEAIAVCDRYLGVSRAQADAYRWVRVEIISARYVAHLLHGTPGLAATTFETDSDTAAMDRTYVHLARGLTAIANGAWSTARLELRTTLVAYSVADYTGLKALAYVGEALAAAASGDQATARDLLERGLAEPLRSSAVLLPFMQMLHLDTLLWLRSPEAAAFARTLAEQCRAAGYAQVELEALHRTLDRSGRRAPATPEVLDRIAELCGQVSGARATAIARHVEAVCTHDSTLIQLAERELSRCGLWLPPLTESAVGQLTRREREIASLAASGMTSRVIAERLVLSVRTVDSHLSRVFNKTGVHSREELARVLR